MRSDISSVILTMLKLGVTNLVKFDFMDPPAPETMMRALENLNYLGALSDEGELTALGEQMAELPLDPQLAKALLSSATYGCVPEMLSITAMLSIPPPFVRSKDEEAEAIQSAFGHPESDHLMLLNVYREYVQEAEEARKQWCEEHFINPRNLANAVNVRNQLEAILVQLGFDVSNGGQYDDPSFSASVRKSLLSGFFMQVAVKEKTGSYTTVKDMEVGGGGQSDA